MTLLILNLAFALTAHASKKTPPPSAPPKQYQLIQSQAWAGPFAAEDFRAQCGKYTEAGGLAYYKALEEMPAIVSLSGFFPEQCEPAGESFYWGQKPSSRVIPGMKLQKHCFVDLYWRCWK